VIECALQLGSDYRSILAFSQQDVDKLKELKPNQILRAKLYGVKKPRSYQQLKLYWACCGTVADNLEEYTKDDVNFEVRTELKFVKHFKVVKGVAYVELRSISFSELAHIEACNYFDRAFPVMAKMIGITVEKLLENAEMGRT
jgi:hypothetical protein